MRHLTEEQIRKLYEFFPKRIKIKDIAREMGIAIGTVASYFKRLKQGSNLNELLSRKTSVLLSKIPEVHNKYMEGVPIKDLVIEYKIKDNYLYSLLKRYRAEHGLPSRKRKPSSQRKIGRNREIIEAFLACRNQCIVAEQFGISRERVRQILNRYGNGLNTKSPGKFRRHKRVQISEADLQAISAGEKTCKEVAEEMGFCENAILKKARIAGIYNGRKKQRERWLKRIAPIYQEFLEGATMKELIVKYGFPSTGCLGLFFVRYRQRTGAPRKNQKRKE